MFCLHVRIFDVSRQLVTCLFITACQTTFTLGPSHVIIVTNCKLTIKPSKEVSSVVKSHKIIKLCKYFSKTNGWQL